MRIITQNFCSNCCYFIEDYDNKGLCCRNSFYRNTTSNRYACKHFCSDKEQDDIEITDNFDDDDEYMN